MLAGQFGPPGGVVGRVSIREPCVIAQIAQCIDASLHPDIEAIRDIVHGSDLPGDLIRELSSSILPRGYITELLAGSPGLQSRLMATVEMWGQCLEVALGAPEAPDSVGEFFFEAPAGYQVGCSPPTQPAG
jgi:hypothetical protein